MAILVVNCGSSSLKVSLFTDALERIFDAEIKGFTNQRAKLQTSFSKEVIELDAACTVSRALALIFDTIQKKYHFALPLLSGIGHRFVHGGPRFTSTLLLDAKSIKELAELRELAPLHNGPCLEGILASIAYFGDKVRQVAVFDTAFYSTLPEVAASYAISAKLAIRRYGFHGISHAFLWQTYAAHSAKQAKIITLHLGNGCSMTAIKDGKPLDTSMGFTPAEGLVMATRAGDIDAAVVSHLVKQEKMDAGQVVDLLNVQSGLLGLSEISSDMQIVLKEYDTHKKARVAVDLFCYRARKYLGAYLTVLEGADGIVFSGGIGENAPFIRKKIATGLNWLGVFLDDQANDKAVNLLKGEMRIISTDSSKIALYVIATDENRFIAKEVMSLT